MYFKVCLVCHSLYDTVGLSPRWSQNVIFEALKRVKTIINLFYSGKQQPWAVFLCSALFGGGDGKDSDIGIVTVAK